MSQYGITPAHAGTTPLLQQIQIHIGDHPRSRGDHATLSDILSSYTGSPPLTRGPRAPRQGCNAPSRITPAHAGTTASPNVMYAVMRDHPRSRGDHSRLLPWNSFVPGSPPLTRGPPQAPRGRGESIRITPAHAGTTWRAPGRPRACPDHPRSRGDHLYDDAVRYTLLGSPPLTRGPQIRFSRNLTRRGITPAHAGTTRFHYPSRGIFWDHPRSRGDHYKCRRRFL